MLCDLLVHVDGGEDGRRRARFAAELAGRTSADLTGLHVKQHVDVQPLYKPSRLDAAVAASSAILTFDAVQAAKIFDEEVASRLPGARWFTVEGDVVEGVTERARYADMVILGQYEWQEPPEANPLPIAHSIVLKCGRPVLVVPRGVQPSQFARIAVAWDGSREAVRAVHDALPLLRMAHSVHLLTVVPMSARANSTPGAWSITWPTMAPRSRPRPKG